MCIVLLTNPYYRHNDDNLRQRRDVGWSTGWMADGSVWVASELLASGM